MTQNTAAKTYCPAPISPHFAFNVLNHIQYFIQQGDKTQALKYLSSFSKMLRLYGRMAIEENVKLKQEFCMVELYLELEQMRYGELFSYEIGSCPSHMLALPALIIYQHVEITVHELLLSNSSRYHLMVAAKADTAYLSVTISHSGGDKLRFSPELRVMKDVLITRLRYLQEEGVQFTIRTNETELIIPIRN